MKTQISRKTFDGSKRYSGVYQQQGRMLSDADWNELSDIIKERVNDVLVDVIGSGTPRDRGLVNIVPNGDGTETVSLKWGHVYVDGIVGQVRAALNSGADPINFEYDKQADFPDAPDLPADGNYKLYVDVWERTVTYLEDETLRDPALHGADTCTRTQTMAQVKWCESEIDPEDEEQNPAIGDADLTLELRAGSTKKDECDPCAEVLLLDEPVGNYLFRVEIHDLEEDSDGNLTLTLKWSSENGAEQYAVGNEPNGFKSDKWTYEFFSGTAQDFASEKHLGQHLVDEAGFPVRYDLEQGYPDSLPADYPNVRRWDGHAVLNFDVDTATWSLDSGHDRGVDLSESSDSDAPSHVELGTELEINLTNIILTLDLDEKVFLAGDFWCLPVRESVHKVGDVFDLGEPHGILHHYMELVTFEAGVITSYADKACKRFEFPPLTDIMAEDVCYDNSACDQSTADTVQEALDELCQQRDLRWHNKHLHGWGIVCGLQVLCAPEVEVPIDIGVTDGVDIDGDGIIDAVGDGTVPGDSAAIESLRRDVTIHDGYAIDCEGSDLVLELPRIVTLMDEIEQYDQLNPENPLLVEGDGTVCLSIELDDNGDIVHELEPYENEDFSLASLFDGTIWEDFYEDCIEEVLEAVVEEIDPNPEEEQDDGALISARQKRFISLFNLGIQIINRDNGSYVFLSQREHDILEAFYNRLREILQSKTFCAMFEGDDFPAYPFPGTGLDTIFARDSHDRIRIDSVNHRAYTIGGADNIVNVYDLQAKEIIQQLDVPAGEGAITKDLAFSEDGQRLYTVSSLREADTVFAVADFDGTTYNWRQITVICDVLIVTLERSAHTPDILYGIGKGKGLYIVHPDQILSETKPRPLPLYGFNAVHHLEINPETQMAYATAADESENEIGEPNITDTYDRVVQLDLSNVVGEMLDVTNTIMLGDVAGASYTGDDGIAVGFSAANNEEFVYVVVDGPNGDQKYILTYNPTEALTSPINSLIVEDSVLRLDFHKGTEQLLIIVEEGYRMEITDARGEAARVMRHPLQISPISIDQDTDTDTIYVLNYFSNTISIVPAAELLTQESEQVFLDTLLAYRDEIFLAFFALLSGLLQYLKDCFCNHLLIRCPECTDEDKIYLATIEIRDNEVYKVCNFAKRKYVKSFPTVGYWLSVIPIIPLLKKGVEALCCSVLEDWFKGFTDNYKDEQPATVALANNTIDSKNIREGRQLISKVDFKSEMEYQLKNIGTFSRLMKDAVFNRIETAGVGQSGIRKGQIIGNETQDAQRYLQENNIQVTEVKQYNPKIASDSLRMYRDVPQRVNKDEKLVIYEEKGRVVYYGVEKVAGTTTDSGTGAAAVSAETKAEVAAFEKRKAELENLDAVNNDITALQNQKLQLQNEVSNLKTEMDGLVQSQRTVLTEIAKAQPASTVAGVDKEVSLNLANSGFATVEAVANANAADLMRVDNSLTEAKATEIIGNANSKMNITFGG